jgi:pectate lyase
MNALQSAYPRNVSKTTWGVFARVLALAVACHATASVRAATEQGLPSAARYKAAIVTFADRVLESGRDRYGANATPLFADGLHVKTLQPATWKGPEGANWILCNVASQQSLMRLLDGLTALTGDRRYLAAAEAATRHALDHQVSPNGLLYWGGHSAWDLETDRPVGNKGNITVHELKGQQAHYRLMWRVNPDATRRLMESIWAGHILDWSLLDFNRHASNTRKPPKPWEHSFNETIQVPFPTAGANLAFCNVTPMFVDTGMLLSVLGNHEEALTWTRRMLHRWQQARDPRTGLSGGQLSYRTILDRAQQALGHVHPQINEARIVASYHQTSRYHQLPAVQLLAGEALIAAGGRRAEVGREFIAWASDDLQAYAKHCRDPATGKFNAVMTDGTPLEWRKAHEGYYNQSSFAPVAPDGLLLWGYALAWRLTREPAHWTMLQHLFRSMKLGELGEPNGRGRALNRDAGSTDFVTIYALLELDDRAADGAILRLAGKIGDNLLALQSPTGLFPRRGREWARTGDDIPLALLHLVAAIERKRDRIPPPAIDRQFFHAVYHGELEPHQKKRADERTYDSLVFYGGND